jgi:3'-phosphoadenosine 5'-phosphosulfate sulfotransferase (PAPS reductase)/FAD synthetase
MSGGKDSLATALVALETQPRAQVRFAFADTGNEHESTPEYIEYLQVALGIEVVTLRADFSAEVIRFREYVRDHWPRKGVPLADCDERPPSFAEQEYLSWDCALLAQGALA